MTYNRVKFGDLNNVWFSIQKGTNLRWNNTKLLTSLILLDFWQNLSFSPHFLWFENKIPWFSMNFLSCWQLCFKQKMTKEKEFWRMRVPDDQRPKDQTIRALNNRNIKIGLLDNKYRTCTNVLQEAWYCKTVLHWFFHMNDQPIQNKFEMSPTNIYFLTQAVYNNDKLT